MSENSKIQYRYDDLSLHKRMWYFAIPITNCHAAKLFLSSTTKNNKLRQCNKCMFRVDMSETYIKTIVQCSDMQNQR